MTTTPTSGRHLKAHGRYPRSAYRAFASKTYAEEFACSGKFRMGNLRAYSSSEDAQRRDPSEGEGHFQRFGTVTSVDFVPRSDETSVSQAPGYVHTHTELLNPKFLLSCSLPGSSRLEQHRINPYLLFSEAGGIPPGERVSVRRDCDGATAELVR